MALPKDGDVSRSPHELRQSCHSGEVNGEGRRMLKSPLLAAMSDVALSPKCDKNVPPGGSEGSEIDADRLAELFAEHW